MLDLTLERSEKEFTLRQELQTAREQLLNSMNEWRLRYCLIAPVGGVVTFTKYWNENQYIPSGEVAFTVVPQGEGRLSREASGRSSVSPISRIRSLEW